MTGGGSSLPEVQRLLRVLGAGRRCAEMGTAFGEGAAALAGTAASVVTVEIDEERAAVARERLRGYENVELVVGDWEAELPPRGPFDLLFVDSGGWKEDLPRAAELFRELVVPGGLLVKDDLTPGRRGPDPVRSFFFDNFAAVEVLTSPTAAVIVAART